MFDWFKTRRYKHLDFPVSESFALKANDPAFVAKHSFSPLIYYVKSTKRYKPNKGKTETKERPIMYASHRDACILSCYASKLNEYLEEFYKAKNLSENVIAYRTIGKTNYHLSAETYAYACVQSPCTILAFDVSGFFDNLDHRLLKRRLKNILGVASLSDDWLRIFRVVTKFHYVELETLKAHPNLADAFAEPGPSPIGTIAKIKGLGIPIHGNPKAAAGIPQGTPISAALSNLYMMEFDIAARDFCATIGALYRRYSDDILIICPPTHAADAEVFVAAKLKSERLELSAAKSERTAFDVGTPPAAWGRSAQYLGFAFYPGGAGIRPGSLSRQWRKMRRSVRRAMKAAEAAASSGKVSKVFTKRLWRRFAPLQFRNFSSYARRSAIAFGGQQKIVSQVRKFERAFEREIERLK